MRKIVCGAFVSLDGVMQAPGGPKEDTSGGFKYGGWLAPHFDETAGEGMRELFSVPYDLLLGRKTYDIFSAYWPLVTEVDQDHPIAEQFNKCTKYVATHRPKTLTPWVNTTPLGKDAVAALRKLKKEDGPVLLTQGSCDFLQTLFANDLVDELNLLTFPITLGKGKKLFAQGTLPRTFRLVKSTVSKSGVVIGRYERVGEVKTDSVHPTLEEVKRRKKLKRAR